MSYHKKTAFVKKDLLKLVKQINEQVNGKNTVAMLEAELLNFLNENKFNGRKTNYNDIFKFIKQNTLALPSNINGFTVNFKDKNDPKYKQFYEKIIKPILQKLTANDKIAVRIELEDEKDEKVFYNLITIDNISKIRHALQENGMIDVDDDFAETDDIEYDSEAFFGTRDLRRIRSISFHPIKQPTKKLKSSNMIHYFPYYHTIPGLDLSKYQIYDKPQRTYIHCAVNALKHFGIDISNRIPEHYIKSSDILELLNKDYPDVTCGIRIYHIETRESDYKFTENIRSNQKPKDIYAKCKIKLLSMFNHIMPDEIVPVTRFYLENFNEIPETKRNPLITRARKDYKTENGIKIEYTRYISDKPTKMELHLVLSYLYQNNLLKPISLYDSLFADEISTNNKNVNHFKDIVIKNRCNPVSLRENKTSKIIYEEDIQMNLKDTKQKFKHGKVMSELDAQRRLHVNVSTIIDIPFNEFMKIVNKTGFNCVSIASYAHSLFLSAYKKLGVKELCGPIIKDLDKKRKSGIRFNKPGKYEDVITIDVNGLYPYALSQIDIPIGEPTTEKVENGLKIGDYYWNTISSDIIKKRVDKLYELKQTAENEYEKKFYKAILCSIYGKCMEHQKVYDVKLVSTKEQLYERLYYDYYKIKGFYKTNNGYAILPSEQHYVIQYYKNILNYSLLHVGLAVVKKARKLMKDYLNEFKRRDIPVYLVNVDSITFPTNRYDEVKEFIKISKDLGDFKVERESKELIIHSQGKWLMYNSDDDYKLSNKRFLKGSSPRFTLNEFLKGSTS